MLVRVHALLQEAVFSSVLCSSFQACLSMEALREYFFLFLLEKLAILTLFLIPYKINQVEVSQKKKRNIPSRNHFNQEKYKYVDPLHRT